jgi:IS30 family transposase
MHYKQLAQEQRYQISALLKAGFNQSQIAMELNCHKSTISREIARNTGLRGYRPKQAQRLAEGRKHAKARRRISSETWNRVRKLIQLEWSPEQISLWLKAEHKVAISHEWIYQFIARDKAQGGLLYRHLRCQKKRRKRYGRYSRRGQIPNQTFIDKRPAIVDRRARFGDWELDTVIGKGHRQALVTLVERKSRLTLIAKVKRKTASAVSAAIIRLLEPLADRVHTLTADNGREFAWHEVIAKALGARFYFAHPYASWERGLNKNTNGPIRQYFPRQHDFTIITQGQIDRVMDRLNNRLRKTLGIKTPNQVFFGIKPSVAFAS